MTVPTAGAVLSTECVNGWCGTCTYARCIDDCHQAPGRAVSTPPRTPSGGGARERVYDALVTHHREHGYAPSVRDLAAAANLATSTTAYHLARLAADGRISIRPGRARTVTPVREARIPA